MMKKFIPAIATLSLCLGTAHAELTQGEYFQNNNGELATVGQTNSDHLFVRNTYQDTGKATTYDNVVSFKSGATQTVWFWLDDDDIYQNARVQSLTPCDCDEDGNSYNEITYSTTQFEINLPMSIRLTRVGANYIPGDRLPYDSYVTWNEQADGKIIDGIKYRKYKVIIYNRYNWGCHFSASDGSMYLEKGALRKNDAPLIGLYLINDNQMIAEGELSNMIIANMEFDIQEAILAGWVPNEYRFFYGTGGNNVEPRFQLYNRVRLYGSKGIPAITPGDVNNDGIVDVNDIVMLIDYVLGKSDISNPACADVNNDSLVDIADVPVLIATVLNS